MRKLLNTLFVTTQGTYLRKEGQAIAVNRDKKTIMRLPLHNLSSIVVFGRVLVSPYLMHFCSENNIFIAFHREDGRFLARVDGPVSGNVLLRREQFRAADSPVRFAAVARNILLAKLANSKQVLLRFLRDHPSPENQAIEDAASYLKALMRKLAHGHEWDLELLRGMEGSAAERYFSVFDALIRNEEAGFRFSGRSRRPRWTLSMRCCLLHILCSAMKWNLLWSPLDWTLRSVFCIVTARGGRRWHWICWRNSGLFWGIAWCSPY